MVQLFRILNNEIDVKVRIGKHLSSKFKSIRVVRREDAIAPLLFNTVLEIAIGRSRVKLRGNIFDQCSQIMARADKVVVVGRRFKDIKN
jgi:hypothetical protein